MKLLFIRRAHVSVKLLPLVGCLVIAGMLSGCPQQPEKEAETDKKAEVNPDAEIEQEQRCTETINSALDMFRPERMEISSDRTTALSLVNQWMAHCVNLPPESRKLTADQRALYLSLIDEDQLERVDNARFTSRDGSHIRDCQLFNAVVDYAAERPGEQTKGDLDRVVNVFYFTMRNITLGSLRIPFSPFQVMLMGAGTVADRTLVFCELLKQLKIDAVVIRIPGTAEKGAEDDPRNGFWLVGVPLEGEVYLFDPFLGLPIPSAAEQKPTTAEVTLPATLREVRENPELLKQFDLKEQKYPLSGANLKDITIEMVGHSSYWAPRMRQLQMVLSGEHAFVVHDGLEDYEELPGLVSRIRKGFNLPEESKQLKIWGYPESLYQASQDMDEKQKQIQGALLMVFECPMEFAAGESEDGKGGMKPVVGERLMLKNRLDQLMGQLEPCIGKYLIVRLKERLPADWNVSRDYRQLHLLAGEYAFYWIGVSQFELGEYDAAAETFRDYAQRYPKGLWLLSSQRARALSLAIDGKFAGAASIISERVPNDIRRFGFAYLAKRYQALLEQSRQ